jgi:hypothetical protein
MDSSVSPKDEIWFLLVGHHISNAVYHGLGRPVATLKSSNGDVFPVRGNIEIAFSVFLCLITYLPEECGSLYSALFLTRHRRSSLSSLQWLACQAMLQSSLHTSLCLLCINKAQGKSLRVGGGDTVFQI